MKSKIEADACFGRLIQYQFLFFCGFLSLIFPESIKGAKACFTTKDTLGCVPYTVTMDECTNGGNGIQYKFGNSLYVRTNTHTFTEPGVYSVTQLIQGNTGNGDNILSRPNYIKVIRSVAPEFKVLLCDNRQVNVKITDQQFPEYIIYFGDGDSLLTTPNSNNLHTYLDLSSRIVSVTGRFLSGVCPTSASASVVPVNSLAFEKFFSVLNFSRSPDKYEFSINTNPNLSYSFYSGGGNLVHSFEGQSGISEFFLNNVADSSYYFEATSACGVVYESMTLTLKTMSVVLKSNSVVLNWPAYPTSDLKHYYVYRDDGQLVEKKIITMGQTYEDFDVKCGKSYCYKLETSLKDSSFYTTEKCVVAASDFVPEKAENIKATFNDNNRLMISWSIPSSSSFKKAIVSSSSNNQSIYTGINSSFETDNYTQDCYSLKYIDSCDKASEPVSMICPIILTVNPLGRGLYGALWSTHTPAFSEISYQLFENDKLIYSGSSPEFVTAESDTINQIKTYKVIGTASNGVVVQSNTVKLEQEMKVYFPTAFSPNEDGLNDSFAPKTRFVKKFKMGVYNIWGELVFTTTELSMPWFGDNQPNGTYTYMAEVEDILGNSKQFRGQVTIVK
jgi:hypothetical protein